MTYDCLIIGAGASGLYCAARILAQRECRVAIIDSNHIAGKKLLMTGGGRCNLTNSSIELNKYNTDDPDRLGRILELHDHKAVITFFEKELGIALTAKDNLYYPATFKAPTVVNGLVNYLQERGCDLIFDEEVLSIAKTDNNYVINSNYRAKNIVLATGGASYPKTGSKGAFVSLLTHFVDDDSIVPLKPALVPLTIAEKDIKRLSGAKSACSLKLYSGSDKSDIIGRSSGELLFTDYGISGIMVLDISSAAVNLIAKGGKPIVSVNLLNKPYNEALELIRYVTGHFPDRRIIDALAGLVRDDIVYVALGRIKTSKDKLCSKITDAEIQSITDVLTGFDLTVTGSKGFDNAQITSGGLKLSCVNDYLSLPSYDSFFVCGETLNCDGICGGYNLQFAWSSADLASEGVIRCLN